MSSLWHTVNLMSSMYDNNAFLPSWQRIGYSHEGGTDESVQLPEVGPLPPLQQLLLQQANSLTQVASLKGSTWQLFRAGNNAIVAVILCQLGWQLLSFITPFLGVSNP